MKKIIIFSYLSLTQHTLTTKRAILSHINKHKTFISG